LINALLRFAIFSSKGLNRYEELFRSVFNDDSDYYQSNSIFINNEPTVENIQDIITFAKLRYDVMIVMIVMMMIVMMMLMMMMIVVMIVVMTMMMMALLLMAVM